jgi:outer membrane protein TolC
MNRMLVVSGVMALTALNAGAACAQTPPRDSGGPIQLATLQQQALEADPRTRELTLLDEQTRLRIRNITLEALPTLTALGQSQYQSDVPRAPFTLASGQALFSPPKGTYDLSLRLDEHLLDPTRQPRLALAEADLAVSQARVRTTLFTVRDQVNEAFFTAALLDEQIAALSTTLDDLAARSREMAARVREGAALAADRDVVDAAVLQYQQQDAELRATRAAALSRLSSLTGQAIAADARLALPDLADAVARARGQLDRLRARPEYEQYARTREQTARQEDMAAASERPQLSGFGRAGYGQPGLNFIGDRPESYALAGVQVQWKGWTWRSASRERQALGLQRAVVSAEEAAFTEQLQRSATTELSTIDRLAASLALDDRIVALRRSVDDVARVRLSEGAVTAAEYLDRHTELLAGQFAQAGHGVELARAQAALLTMLGLEVR